MIKIIFVGLGGFAGAVLRYLIGLIPVKMNSAFPIKTLVINVIGAFVIGLITAFAAKNKALNQNIILMLQVGLCGGFTTFSTFAYESADLIKSGETITALIYMILSAVLSILAVFIAQALVK